MPARSRSQTSSRMTRASLAARLAARLVVAHERPLEHRDRPGEHALDRLPRERLRIGDPVHGHGGGSVKVAVDDGRLDGAGAVALHPAVRGGDVALQLLAEVLNHVVAFRLAVNEHVQTGLLLETDGALDLLADEVLVLLGGEFAAVAARTRLSNLRRLRETSRWWWWGRRGGAAPAAAPCGARGRGSCAAP